MKQLVITLLDPLALSFEQQGVFAQRLSDLKALTFDHTLEVRDASGDLWIVDA